MLLVVLDAVRADALGIYGAGRDTSPNLARLARRGVRFENARSTAPWTLASHASLFTGRWPSRLGTGIHQPLDATYPTLAEYLASRGYATAGFAANYAFCTSCFYGLDRGFAHYEDRPVSLDDILGSSGLGRLLVPALDAVRYAVPRLLEAEDQINPVDSLDVTHRRDAGEINRAFLRAGCRAIGTGPSSPS